MRKLVLVVAQETALRAQIARLLQPAGYAVELAASEKRALELVVKEDIDTAIVVPGSGLAGLVFARQLSDRVPRLMVLAERPADIARLGRSLPGTDVYLAQPLDERQLLERLAQVMGSPWDDATAPEPAAMRFDGCRIDLAGRADPSGVYPADGAGTETRPRAVA
jgi:DNA-binding response OmpR family regulator